MLTFCETLPYVEVVMTSAEATEKSELHPDREETSSLSRPNVHSLGIGRMGSMLSRMAASPSKICRMSDVVKANSEIVSRQ